MLDLRHFIGVKAYDFLTKKSSLLSCQEYSLKGSNPRGVRVKMKKISLSLLFLIVGLTLGPIQEVKAQNIAGDYQVTVKGTNCYLDITPAERRISDRTTMKITQAAEKITVTFGTFASAMATTAFKGKVGNHLMCAVWWYQGSPDETKVLWGEVSRDGRTITGKLIYPRVAYRDEGPPGTPRFVPGWVEVNFTAKKTGGVAKPDLRVTRMRAVRKGKNCYLQVTIKNAGTAGVPESAYHKTKGASIQMWKGTKAWGGIRLFGADPTKKLKTPGASVVHDWFPGAANLRFTGTATFKCEVDNNHVVDELNEGNNTLTKRLTCKADGGAGPVLKVIYPTNSQDFKIVNQKLVITVKFNRPVNPATVTARNSFKVWTERDSNAAGTLAFSDGNKTVKWTSTKATGDLLSFDPDGFFRVILDGTGANAIKDADGGSLDGDKDGSPGGDFSHQFILIG